jgi:hypothetical protein
MSNNLSCGPRGDCNSASQAPCLVYLALLRPLYAVKLLEADTVVVLLIDVVKVA